MSNPIQQEARRILDTLAFTPFELCQLLSPKFGTIPTSAASKLKIRVGKFLLISEVGYSLRCCCMQKQASVRLTAERSQLQAVLKPLKGSNQTVRRAQILLKADSEGAACRRL